MSKFKMDKLKKCFRCQGINTEKIALTTNTASICFVGWCHSCDREYVYKERIVDVPPDKEKRI